MFITRVRDETYMFMHFRFRDLSYNNISMIEDRVFEGLPSLMSMYV
jgi:hypothetical protein